MGVEPMYLPMGGVKRTQRKATVETTIRRTRRDTSASRRRTSGRSLLTVVGLLLLLGSITLGATVGAVSLAVGTAASQPSTEHPFDPGHNDPVWVAGESGALTLGDAPGPSGPVLALAPFDTANSFVLLAAYSKYNDVSPLEHEVRSDIMGMVGALPGLYFAQLVARTKRPESTVRYHTKILEREGELRTATILGNLRLFPKSIDPAAFAYLAAKREPATARVIDAIEEAEERLTISELAERINRAPSTVSHHLSRLEEEALIERTRNGESVRVSLADGFAEMEVDRTRKKVPAAA